MLHMSVRLESRGILIFLIVAYTWQTAEDMKHQVNLEISIRSSLILISSLPMKSPCCAQTTLACDFALIEII